MDSNEVILIDIRYPLLSVSRFNNHQDTVNAMTWAPTTGKHLCTVSDD